MALVVLVAVGVAVGLVVFRHPTVADARPLTAAEADALAVVRFQNYRAGALPVSITLPAAAGTVRLRGAMNFRTGAGSLVMRTDRRSDVDSAGIVQFTLAGVAFHPGPTSAIPQPLPTEGWQLLPLRTDGSNPLDTVLALLIGLGADRPENAQLLRQQGARWLRTDRVDGTAVTVFAGPSGQAAQGASSSAPASAGSRTTAAAPVDTGGSRTRYWLDHDGRLRRFQARIGSNPDFAEMDLGVHPARAPALYPGLPSSSAAQPSR